MKNQQIKKNILKILALTAVLGIVAIFWYRQPIPQYTATTLCSLEGKQIQVVIDVTWQRFLFAPTKVKGTVTVDGIPYTSEVVEYGNGRFFDKLKAKFSSKQRSYLFSRGSMWTHDHDMLYLEHTDGELGGKDSLGISCWILPHGQHGNHYYGPAKNVDEVNALLAKWGWISKALPESGGYQQSASRH